MCYYCEKNGQKLDKNRRVFCNPSDCERVIFFSACNADAVSNVRMFFCVVGAYFYVQFSWQQCTSEKLVFFVNLFYYRYAFLY